MKRKFFFLSLTIVSLLGFLIMSVFLPHPPTAPFTWDNVVAFAAVGALCLFFFARFLQEVDWL